jgi:hypothetical protein
MKAGLPDTLTLAELLKERFPRGDVARVGIDPKVVTYEGAKMLREQLQPKEDVEKDGAGASARELVPVQENLVDQVWTHDLTPEGSGGKPDRRVSDVFVLEEKYTGTSSELFLGPSPNTYTHITARLNVTCLPNKRTEHAGETRAVETGNGQG